MTKIEMPKIISQSLVSQNAKRACQLKQQKKQKGNACKFATEEREDNAKKVQQKNFFILLFEKKKPFLFH